MPTRQSFRRSATRLWQSGLRVWILKGHPALPQALVVQPGNQVCGQGDAEGDVIQRKIDYNENEDDAEDGSESDGKGNVERDGIERNLEGNVNDDLENIDLGDTSDEEDEDVALVPT